MKNLRFEKEDKIAPESSKPHQEHVKDVFGLVYFLQKGKTKEIPKPKTQGEQILDILKIVN